MNNMKLINESMELRYNKLMLKTSFLFLPFMLLFAVESIYAKPFLIGVFIFGLMIFFFYIYYGSKIKYLKNEADNFIYQYVKFESAKGVWHKRNAVYFDVLAKDIYGKIFKGKTRPIFFTRGSLWYNFSTYNNKEVLIGVHKETNKIVVIGNVSLKKQED